jgi:excisionase family DNA binding protein
MQKLNIEQRLNRIEENIAAIKRMMEELSRKPTERAIADDDNEIMTVKQVGKYLDLDVNVIYAKCAKADMPYFRIGKGYRFKKADILKWMEEQREGSELSVEDYVDKYMQKHVLKG